MPGEAPASIVVPFKSGDLTPRGHVKWYAGFKALPKDGRITVTATKYEYAAGPLTSKAATTWTGQQLSQGVGDAE